MGIDKEYEPGGSFYRDADCCHLSTRPKREQLLEIPCLRCGAAPMAWCDRSQDLSYLRTVRGLRLFAEGTPDSHQERKWAWQGHDPAEFPALRERERGGPGRAPAGITDMAEVDQVIDCVSCPVHDAQRGARCPGEPGVCVPRVRKWMLARDQQITRQKQRRAAARRRDAAA